MDEPALIRAAQDGDLDAFNRLVLQHQTRVYNLAYHVIGEADAAADAAQEAFVAAWENIRRYRGGSFRAWLFRIVTNACYDELRRRQRRPAASLEALDTLSSGPDTEGEAQFAGGAELPEDHARRRELQRAIQRCLAALPDDQRLVAVMADVQAFDYAEIAVAVGAALGTVKSRLARARAKLRDCLRRTAGELLPTAFRLEEETPRP